MSLLANKNILIGVCGGIAAYKIPYLVRLLIVKQANVKIVMTKKAKKFVSPLTLATLSKNAVTVNFVKSQNHQIDWNNHVELALWADYMVIAPATANTIAKLSHGNCDNLLTAVYQSSKCPVYIAPAMDLDMYKHPSNQHNINQLESYGNYIIYPEEGELASGLYGKGRMCEIDTMIQFIESSIREQLPLAGKKVLLTAGPTYEAIDPVRFIGNHSSGKMGYELANTFSKQGAMITLVSGPTHLSITDPQVTIHRVMSSDEMYQQVLEHYQEVDIVIMVAAVADFKPKEVHDTKIKKGNTMDIALAPTVDILSELGKIKTHQLLIGFALETNNAMEYAKDKLKKKNLDLIVLNSLEDKGAGFGTETNKISIINPQGNITEYDTKTKECVAQDIVEYIKIIYYRR